MVSRHQTTLIQSSAVATLLVVTALPLSAQSVKVNAPKQYEAGSPFNITYVINTTEDVEVVSNLKLSGLELLYGPAIGTSRNVSIINGKVSSSSTTEITYTVLAPHEGKASASGLRLRVGGNEIAAAASIIQIQGGHSGNALGGFGRQEREERPIANRGQAQYSYHAIVPRRSVYVQEALPIIYKLQASERPNINGTKPTSYDGFVSHDLLGNDPRQMNIERIGGRDWVTVEVMKELLFAQHAGELTIPANELPILYTHRDPSGDPFLNQTEERILRTEPIKIQVKALPEDSKPLDFSGAVGSFTARYELSNTTWKTNEATTLRLILEGQGNLKIAKLPRITLPSDIEVYDPVEKSEQKYEGGALRSRRVIEYNLIPRSTGKITIPSVSLSFFNPNSAQYQTTATKALQVNIQQGKAKEESTTLLGSNKQVDDNTPYGLLPIKESKLFSPQLWLLALLHLGLAIISLVYYGVMRRRRKERADSLGFAASRANAMATKRLKLAHKHMSEGKREAFLEETLQALWGYLGDKLKLPTSDLSRENVSQHLGSQGFTDEDIKELTDSIDALEFARFAPSFAGGSMTELYDQVARVITRIESIKR